MATIMLMSVLDSASDIPTTDLRGLGGKRSSVIGASVRKRVRLSIGLSDPWRGVPDPAPDVTVLEVLEVAPNLGEGPA